MADNDDTEITETIIPPFLTNALPGSEYDSVLVECHQMLDKLRYRSGAMKLLLLTKATLETFLAYKANRHKVR